MTRLVTMYQVVSFPGHGQNATVAHKRKIYLNVDPTYCGPGTVRTRPEGASARARVVLWIHRSRNTEFHCFDSSRPIIWYISLYRLLMLLLLLLLLLAKSVNSEKAASSSSSSDAINAFIIITLPLRDVILLRFTVCQRDGDDQLQHVHLSYL